MRELPIDDTVAVERAFADFPSGVAALSALVDGVPVGLVSTSFTVGVSFQPPQVLFSVRNASTTWPVLRTASRIGVSVLARGHEGACLQLASRSRDRFADLPVEARSTGAIFLRGSVMWLDCEIQAEIPSGDHHVVVLGVHGLTSFDGAEPLVYHGRAFRRLMERAEIAA